MRPGSFEVGIVGAPHDPVDADAVTILAVRRMQEGRTEIALTLEVLGRAQREIRVEVLEVRAVVVALEHVQRLVDPGATLLGHHELEVRVALEDTRPQEGRERPVREPGHLADEHGRGGGRVPIVG
jgi:hypothetical protein